MKKGIFWAAGALAMLEAGTAQAQDSSYSIGITGGTLGIGPEVGARLSPMFGVRGSATFLGVSHSVDGSDITYDGKLKLASYGLMADVYPFEGGFRLSAGFRIDKNKIRLKASPTQAVEIGGDLYTPAQIGTLSGHVKAKEFAPMLTLGYGGGVSQGVKFGVDGGVMFHGTPRIRDLKATGGLASDPAFLNSIADEQREIERDIDQYKVYPVLQLSLSYAF
ncbi:hypothetical protein GCM10007897_14710 [Sphingobium jiangsuense]|uniref:Outer membrane protein beta-barrel domain-containing protein n=1 Tax=Sphingobium jiangsuense TaxID=870476 RepID=A0A7W6BHG2_9SPHN|nr:hypothetical protein [Sphingobium jiangsuense]MBB3925086.1 hypothetical protein [Sphingobium jiangsuense]GLT00087.1 hypothetical protein GCM10007897_14710 [Sphingobium jiangsuense]